MIKLLEYIIREIIGDAASLSIKETESDEGITYEVTIPEEVSGKVIGKGGQNIKAIRDVVNIIARKEGKRIFIKVLN